MLDVVWDMETNDPDDFLTLLLLLGHPQVKLRAITITPGSTHQVGLVKKALSWFDAEIPIGAYNIRKEQPCVSAWHERAYGKITPSDDALPGGEVLHEYCDADTTLITGAPLKNLGEAMKLDGFVLGRWVAQGGFAGEGVVPKGQQLEKFKGLTTAPTFNFNGAPKAALRAIAHPGISARRFVSKNVCHGVLYDAEFHARIGALKPLSRSLELIHQGMETYLRRRDAKALHDPLAACCAIDPEIGQWAEVEVYREKGQWGSRLKPGSGSWIITGYNRERFFSVLTAR